MIHNSPSYICLSADDANVMVIQTTNAGLPSTSEHLYGGCNLGLHVNDSPERVHQHRAQLLTDLQLEQPQLKRIHWLNQVHGNAVCEVSPDLPFVPVAADAHITLAVDTALAIMTADCVPVMISNADGQIIAGVHAGWQGLSKNIILQTIAQMLQKLHPTQTKYAQPSSEPMAAMTSGWQAWIGACISQAHYEVDDRVRMAVLASLSKLKITVKPESLFRQNPKKPGHYFADLAQVAALQLQACGITHIHQSGLDSFGDARFYSYRRQTQQSLSYTGRMATLIMKKV